MRTNDNSFLDKLAMLLQKAETLVSDEIPESRKSINLNELDISIRMANMINNIGIYTIWDLVHLSSAEILKYRNTHNKHFMLEFY